MLLTLLLAAQPKMVRVAEIQAPYVQGVRMDRRTGNLAFAVMSRAVHFDTGKRKWSEMASMPGEWLTLTEQIDSGRGLVTISSRTKAGATSTSTYRLSDGSLIGRTSEPIWRRVGGLLVAREALLDLNGALVRRNERYTPSYVGDVIWDGVRRLAIKSQRLQMDIGKKDVLELGEDWRPLRKAYLSDFDLPVTSVAGDADHGPFALQEENSRMAWTTGVFTHDLHPVPISSEFKFLASDNGPQGIVGLNQLSLKKVVCLDPVSGKVRFQIASEESPRWLGEHILAGRVLYDGKSGKRLGTAPVPEDALLLGTGSNYAAFANYSKLFVVHLR